MLATALYQHLPPAPKSRLARSARAGGVSCCSSATAGSWPRTSRPTWRTPTLACTPTHDPRGAAGRRRGGGRRAAVEDVICHATVRVGRRAWVFRGEARGAPARTPVALWVHPGMWISYDDRQSLEGVGLVRIELDRKPSWPVPAALVELGLTVDELGSAAGADAQLRSAGRHRHARRRRPRRRGVRAPPRTHLPCGSRIRADQQGGSAGSRPRDQPPGSTTCAGAPALDRLAVPGRRPAEVLNDIWTELDPADGRRWRRGSGSASDTVPRIGTVDASTTVSSGWQLRCRRVAVRRCVGASRRSCPSGSARLALRGRLQPWPRLLRARTRPLPHLYRDRRVRCR